MRALAALRMVWACVIMTRRVKSVSTGKKSPGGAGTHTGHTGTRAHGSHRRTSQPTQPTPTHPHRTTARRPDADPRPTHTTNSRRPAAPEPTAPRGQLRRGRYCSSAHDGVPGPCRFGITPSVSSKLRRSHACKFRCPCNGFLLNVPADRRRVVHDVDAP